MRSDPALTNLRLSTGQEGLWFIHRLAPHSAAYNVTLASMIRSPLDVPRLARAVAAVEARHDLLRSTFVEVDGRPWRVVHPAVAGESTVLEVEDVAGLDEARLQVLAHERSTVPFTLAEGGRGFRVVLFRRSPDDAVLLLAAHHIVADAFSLFVILRDLLTAYRALTDDPSSPALAPLRFSYEDYVRMERELLASPHGEVMANHWRGVCTGSVPAQLLADRPGPGRTGFAGASCGLATPPDFPPRLRAAAKAAKANPFAYLLGVFQSLLHRLTGQSDFVIGMSVAVRSAPGLRDVVGYLVNTLPLRARFEEATTFADAVASAKRQVAQGLVNMGYPVPLMVDPIGAVPAADRPPLFRITFTMLAAEYVEPSLPIPSGAAIAGAEIEYAGTRLSYFDVPQQEGQFDLSVEMRRSGPSLTGVFRYDTDLFERATIADLVDRYLRFLDFAIANPEARVSEAPLVDKQELDQLLGFGVDVGTV